MRKFPRDRGPARALLIVCVALGCHPTAFIGASMRNHPGALAGVWVDSTKTTPEDTALWILDPSGNDASQHVRREARSERNASVTAPFVTARARHYGYWFFQGALQGDANRAICFTNRPGRSAPTCLPFDLDSATAKEGMRRRLVVHGYQGAHSVTNRVLLERLP